MINENITKKYGLVWNMLENIDNDYMTFLLGFVSSIVITEYYEIFQCKISESLLNFGIMTSNIVVLSLATWMLLNFTITFAGIKKMLESYRTPEARVNYVLANWATIGVKLKKLKSELYWTILLIFIDLGINIFKFIYKTIGAIFCYIYNW